MTSAHPTIVAAADPTSIERAVARLRAGGLVAFPTETVYGLAADARDPAAVERIYTLKGRPSSHPLIVHLADGDQLEWWAAEPSSEALRLAEAFWPGPLTLVLRRSAAVPDAVTGGQHTVGLRVPAHPVARALLAAFGSGLAAPSANRFGRVSPTSAAHVAAEFPNADLLILDGGTCEVGVESTIIDLSQAESGSAPLLLRPGGVAAADVESVIGRQLLRPAGAPSDAELRLGATEGAVSELSGRQVPRVPGSYASHYAASAPSRLVAGSELGGAALSMPGSAVLARRSAPVGFVGRWLQLPDEPVAYARALYAALRQLDATAPRQILVEEVPAGEAWLAVRDRLNRATASTNEEPGEHSGEGLMNA